MHPLRPFRNAGASALLGLSFAAACGGDTRGGGGVAWVDGNVLETEQLADLLVLAQPFPLDPVPVAELVRHWVDLTAFVLAEEEGIDVSGREAVAASLWLERRETVLREDRERRFASRASVDPEAAFREGTYRLAAHVLRRVGPATTTAERVLQRRAAERIVERLGAGGSWAEAVAESEDAETRAASGLLGLFAPGDLPADLDAALFALDPGHVSRVVVGPDGFHVLYRPAYADVAIPYGDRLRDRLLADAEQAARLASGEVPPALHGDAVLRARAVAADPESHFADTDLVAGGADGGVQVGILARYVAALPGSARDEMASADDDALGAFVREVVERESRLATAGGLVGEPDAALVAQHAAEVEALRSTLGRTDGGPEAVLDAYLRDVAARRVETAAVPPLFAAWLLDDRAWGIDPAAIAEAIERASALLDGAG